MDSVEEDESFCSMSPSHIVTSAPGKGFHDVMKQRTSSEEGQNDDRLPEGGISLEERLAPLGQASEHEDEMYFDGKWNAWYSEMSSSYMYSYIYKIKNVV